MKGFFTLASVLSVIVPAAVAGGDDPPILELGREAIELFLRAPLAPWRFVPILPEGAFKQATDRATSSEGDARVPWADSLDAILGDSLNSLGGLVVRSKWTVLAPPKSDDEQKTVNQSPMQAQMVIPLNAPNPLEARLGIETDSIRENYFVFSTEIARAQSSLADKWLLWSSRLDYRSSFQEPNSAKAEQRVGLHVTKMDAVGVVGRLEDRNVSVISSPLAELAPAGELYWSHQWLAGLDTSLKIQQVLPDLQTLWLATERGIVHWEADCRASLSPATRLNLTGTTTPDATQYGIRLQLEFLLGLPRPQAPERILTIPDSRSP